MFKASDYTRKFKPKNVPTSQDLAFWEWCGEYDGLESFDIIGLVREYHRMKSREEAAQWVLFDHGRFIRDLQNTTGKTSRTIRRYVESFVRDGQLKRDNGPWMARKGQFPDYEIA